MIAYPSASSSPTLSPSTKKAKKDRAENDDVEEKHIRKEKKDKTAKNEEDVEKTGRKDIDRQDKVDKKEKKEKKAKKDRQKHDADAIYTIIMARLSGNFTRCSQRACTEAAEWLGLELDVDSILSNCLLIRAPIFDVENRCTY